MHTVFYVFDGINPCITVADITVMMQALSYGIFARIEEIPTERTCGLFPRLGRIHGLTRMVNKCW